MPTRTHLSLSCTSTLLCPSRQLTPCHPQRPCPEEAHPPEPELHQHPGLLQAQPRCTASTCQTLPVPSAAAAS